MLYMVQLVALPPKMEPSVYISCELGLQASTNVSVHNNSAHEAKFTSSVRIKCFSNERIHIYFWHANSIYFYIIFSVEMRII